jgi:hypothetical protein
MTNFLPAGIINDTLEEICRRISQMKASLSAGEVADVKSQLQELEEIALDLWVFIEKFACQPLIYTGSGSTEEIINRLEWALAFNEEVNPTDLMKIQKPRKKRTSSK